MVPTPKLFVSTLMLGCLAAGMPLQATLPKGLRIQADASDERGRMIAPHALAAAPEPACQPVPPHEDLPVDEPSRTSVPTPAASQAPRSTPAESNQGLLIPASAFTPPPTPPRVGRLVPTAASAGQSESGLPWRLEDLLDQTTDDAGDLQVAVDAEVANPTRKPRHSNLPPKAELALADWFRAHVAHPFPTAVEREELQSVLNLSERQVVSWFANTRKGYWYRHPSDPSRNGLSDVRLERQQGEPASEGASKPAVKAALPPKGADVLLAWAAMHIRDPYPSDKAKVGLAKETGLTYKQISAWFINYRMRRWQRHFMELSVPRHDADRHPAPPMRMPPAQLDAANSARPARILGEVRLKRKASEPLPKAQSSPTSGGDHAPEEKADQGADKRSRKE